MERLTEWKDDRKLLAKTKFSGDFGSANVLGRLIEKYLKNKVYRINYNKDNGAITLAC